MVSIAAVARAGGKPIVFPALAIEDAPATPALEAALSYPFGIVADQEGALLVADTFNHRIRRLSLK